MDKFDALVSLIQQRIARLDANESVFFARELETVKQKTFETEYQEIKARALFPMNTEADPADQNFTWRQFDKIGMAKIISDFANDIPRIDVSGEEKTTKIKSIADYWTWNINEIRASAKTGRSLDSKLATAAREANLREENRIAFNGSPKHNIPGFLNTPNINTVVLAGDGTGAPNTAWAGKTPDQILRDLNQIANEALVASNGVERSNTLLMPVGQFTDISTRRIPGREITILDFFMKSSATITDIEWVQDLKSSDGLTDICIAYNRDAEKLEMIVPQDWEVLPPQEAALAVKVFGHQRFGGVVVYRPLSVTKAEGI